MGEVYIASMNMRGTRASYPDNITRILNVTSTQAKNSSERLTFSPMSPIVNKYKGFYCFENYWQSGKIYDNIDKETYVNWWKCLECGKRRYPSMRGKKVLYSDYDGIQRDYITSRKDIYVQ